ncbi:proton channel OTOP2-like [Mustelus asterias]
MAEEVNEAVIPHMENEWRLGNLPASALTQQVQTHTGGSQLLAGLLAINAFFLGTALICGGAFSDVAVGQDEVLISLTVMMVLTIGWMWFYVSRTARQKHAILYKDSQAGPVWLRGGLLLFAACSLLLDVFRIVHVAGSKGCEHPIKLLFPSVQIVFIFTQSYFLWVHSKDCIQVQEDITRCGLAISLVCNLMLWMSAVADESIHQTGVESEKHPDNQSQILTAAVDGECLCSTDVCHIFQTGYYFLYPFNIEYSLLASAMLYVMWKNVGRWIDDIEQHGKLRFHFHGIVLGPVLGLAVVFTGLIIFINYEVEVRDGGRKSSALTAYYIFNIVALTLMSISPLIGSFVYRLEKRSRKSAKNPVRSLDVGLLLGAALGQFLISYFSVVATVSVQSPELLNVLSLLFTLLTISQHILQNAFIAEGLCRRPLVEGCSPGLRNSVSVVFTNMNSPQCLPGAAIMHHIQSTISQTHSTRTSDINDQETVSSNLDNIHEDQLPASANKLSCKQRILKEVTSFLLLANVIFWVMPAFGARPHFANGLEGKFYGFRMWAAIVNVGLPMGTFYRMHSVACLLEVYLTS